MAEDLCNVMADSGDEQTHYQDEALETIWEMREMNEEVGYDEALLQVGNKERFERMKQNGLFRVENQKISLTEAGECRARDIMRRHRLAERLFHDVLDLKEFEEDACHFEHAISPEVEEAICTLLGHPPLCPHGKPIPRGRCCALYKNRLKPLVQSLVDMEVGKKARVLFLNLPSIDRLASIGLVPGSVIKLQQRKPTYVLEIDETTLAIDETLAQGIYVKEARNE